MIKKDIELEDVRLFMKDRLNQAPLGDNEKYYKVSISLPTEENSSLNGSFVVIAHDNEQAQDKCVDYTLEMKEKDDLNEIINWHVEPANNVDKIGSFRFSITIGPANAEEFVNQYFKEWKGFVKTDEYATANSNPPRDDASLLSEWKWPIISIPIIILLLLILEYISNQ